MKRNPRLTLATDLETPSPEYLRVFGLDEDAIRAEAMRAHRTALKSFLRCASALAKRPDLMSGPDLLAIRRGMAAIDAACAARSAANELERVLLENAA